MYVRVYVHMYVCVHVCVRTSVQVCMCACCNLLLPQDELRKVMSDSMNTASVEVRSCMRTCMHKSRMHNKVRANGYL